MARVRGIGPADPWAIWTTGLWRAALSSVAVAVVLVGANVVAPDVAAEATVADELESAVVASADPLVELW